MVTDGYVPRYHTLPTRRRIRIVVLMIDVRSTLRTVIELTRENELSLLSAGIAYFAFFSIVPALILVISIGSIVGGEVFAVQIVGLVESYLSEEGNEIVSEALTEPSGLVGASLIGLVAVFWSTLKVFRAIDVAFDRVYDAKTIVGLPRQLLHGTVVVVGIGIGLTLLLTVRLVVTRFDLEVAGSLGLVGVPILIAGLFIVLVPIYYVMPPWSVSARHVLPGTITAVIGLIALQQLFQLYTAFAGQYEAYGFLGVVLLFLLWLYLGAVVLLLGGVINVAVDW